MLGSPSLVVKLGFRGRLIGTRNVDSHFFSSCIVLPPATFFLPSKYLRIDPIGSNSSVVGLLLG